MASNVRESNRVRRNEVVCENLPLVRQVAQAFHAGPRSPVDMTDLLQYGVLGLIDATEKFDAEKGTSFQAYARFRIKGSILDGLRHLDFVPRSVRRKRRQFQAATQRVEQERGGAATEEDLARELDVTQEELRALVESIQATSLSSVEEMAERGAEAELTDAMAARGQAVSPDEDVQRAETRALLAAALDQLPDKERLVLSLYYHDELTMREVGDVLGVTESRVSQLHAKALVRLRGNFTPAALGA